MIDQSVFSLHLGQSVIILRSSFELIHNILWLVCFIWSDSETRETVYLQSILSVDRYSLSTVYFVTLFLNTVYLFVYLLTYIFILIIQLYCFLYLPILTWCICLDSQYLPSVSIFTYRLSLKLLLIPEVCNNLYN